jgi:hypothetical protein
MVVAQSMWVDWVANGNGWRCLSSRCGGNDLVPDCETVGHLGSPFGRADQMTTGPKVLSDAGERKQEPLGLPRRGEAFHHPFPDSGRLMGVLGPVEFSTDVKVLRRKR